MQNIQIVSQKLASDYDSKHKIVHAVCSPEMPDLREERHKLIKISRSCGKNPIERFFKIDPSSEQFVYFADTSAIKPMKKIKLLETRTCIEQYSEISEGERKWWTNANDGYRVGISLKQRKFKPVYYYTQSLHDAKCVKNTIEYVLGQNLD